MKFMIRSDVEGVTGVTTYQQAEGSEFGRSMLANDLNAAIAGLLSTGDHEIVVYDEHTDGRNVALEGLPESVSVICGKPPYRPDWGGIDFSYDAMIMVGYHARSGAEGAVLPHSYSRKNLNIRLNGSVVGEIGMEAAIAADLDVPTWLVTGDSAGMTEAQEMIPGVKTVVVKEAMGEFAARCLPPKLTASLICKAARDVARTPPDVKPLKFDAPVQMQIDLAESDYTEKLRSAYSKIFIKDNTIQIVGETVTEVWSKYTHIQAEVKKQ